LTIVWLKFLICLIIIVLAGRKAAKYGDAISEKTGLGGLWVGVALLAVVTSIPELFTGISAAALVDAPDIAIGDLFGSNVVNLAIIALLDICYTNGVLLTVVGQGGHLRSAALGMVLTGVGALFILGSRIDALGVGWLGLYTPVLLILYLFFMRRIFAYEQSHPAEEEEEEEDYAHMSKLRVYVAFGLSALVIVGAAIWLAFIGDEIATEMNWEQSFVGTVFVAISTSLPEVAVSIAALRIGAVNMAVGNMLGSNLCNMAIVGVVDLFYWEGPVLAAVSRVNAFTGFMVVAMSGIVIAALVFRTSHKTPLRMSWYALVLLLCYALAAYASFQLEGTLE
jgi:cation:H+ antiporter